MQLTNAQLRALADPDCPWCDGAGDDGHAVSGHTGSPCLLCVGQRLSRQQQRWCHVWKDGPEWGAPVDHAEAADRQRYRHRDRFVNRSAT